MAQESLGARGFRSKKEKVSTITQAEFIKQYHANLEAKGWEGLKRAEIVELLDTLHETIMQMLKKKPPAGKNAVAVVRGVGRFTLVKKPRRKGIKPFSSPPEEVWFPASKKVRVTADKNIRNAANAVK